MTVCVISDVKDHIQWGISIVKSTMEFLFTSPKDDVKSSRGVHMFFKASQIYIKS